MKAGKLISSELHDLIQFSILEIEPKLSGIDYKSASTVSVGIQPHHLSIIDEREAVVKVISEYFCDHCEQKISAQTSRYSTTYVPY